jgi:hypothetical protein
MKKRLIYILIIWFIILLSGYYFATGFHYGTDFESSLGLACLVFGFIFSMLFLGVIFFRRIPNTQQDEAYYLWVIVLTGLSCLLAVSLLQDNIKLFFDNFYDPNWIYKK